jgi:hypothetical protein
VALWIARVALLLAAITAVGLARRRADHWPFAMLLAWVLITNIIRSVLASRFGLIRSVGLPPFDSTSLVAFYVDQAFELSSPAWIAAMSCWYFARRRWLAGGPALAWIIGVAYLETHYPEVRGDALRRVYLAAELAALCASALVIVPWIGRHEIPTPGRVCMLTVITMEALLLFAGPANWGFWSRWDLNQAAIAVFCTGITALQVWIWRLNVS